ncbi:replication-relaxation family protein [Kitasatospora fiedleri]|uniref:replication-relaxation family protein n=1 Tax=Kitasatospora fiedleri TaxID=2991545 RepID=UPI00384BB3D8
MSGRDGSVRPDGLLFYGVSEPDSDVVRLRAFVEVDRGTMGAGRLASKLNTYARYWSTKTLPAGIRAGTIAAEQRRPGAAVGAPVRALPTAAVGPHRHRPGRLRQPGRPTPAARPGPARRQDAPGCSGRRGQPGGPPAVGSDRGNGNRPGPPGAGRATCRGCRCRRWSRARRWS